MDKLMTYEEVAKLLNLSERYIAKLVALGEIPPIKIGKSVRFNPTKIQEWVERKSNPASFVTMRSKLTIVDAKKGVVVCSSR